MMFSIPFLPTSRIRPAFLISWHVLSLLQPPCWLPAALAVTLVAALLPSSPLAPCPMLPIRWLVPTVLLVVSAFLRLLRQLPPLLPLSMILTGTLLWLPSLTPRLIWFPVAVPRLPSPGPRHGGPGGSPSPGSPSPGSPSPGPPWSSCARCLMCAVCVLVIINFSSGDANFSITCIH